MVPTPRNKRTVLKPVDGLSGKSSELHIERRALVHIRPAPNRAAEAPTATQEAGEKPRNRPTAPKETKHAARVGRSPNRSIASPVRRPTKPTVPNAM